MKTRAKLILIFLILLANAEESPNKYFNVNLYSLKNNKFNNLNLYLVNPLEKPRLIQPGKENEPVIYFNEKPEFIWSEVKNAVGYVLYIDVKTGRNRFQNIFNSSYYTLIENNSFQLPEGILSKGKTYRWSVRAYNNTGWSGAALPFYFKYSERKQLLPAPKLIAPGGIKPKEIQLDFLKEFKWEKVKNAKEYEFVLSPLKNSKKSLVKKIVGNSKLPAAQFLLNNLHINENYEWKVKAINGKSTSVFSKPYKFKIIKNVTAALPTIKITGEKPEEMFLNFKYSELINTTIEAVYKDNSAYLPFSELFNLLQLYNERDSLSGNIKGFYLSPENKYIIDIKNLQFKTLTKKLKFTKHDYVELYGEVYFLPHFFFDAFGLDFQVSMSDLSLRLNSNSILPVYRKYIDQLKLSSQEFNQPGKTERTFGAKKPLFTLGSFDYLLSSNFGKNSKPFSSYRFGLGGIILGGEGSVISSGNSFEGKIINNRIEWLWRYPVFKNYLTQISLGNILANGLASYNIRGIQITNEPLEPRRKYMNYIFRNRTNPNWTVELYRNNNLMSITKADANGNFEFNLPLDYGTSLIQLKYYGLRGQIIEQEKVFQIPFTLLPPGEMNYNLNIGEIINTHEKLVQANLSFGVNDWLTNQLGFDYLNGSGYTKGIFYNSTSLRVNSNYLFNLTVAPNAYIKTTANGLFSSLSSFDISYTKYFENPFYNQSKISNEINGNVFIPMNIDKTPTNIIFNSQYLNFGKSKRLSLNIGVNSIFENFNPSINYKFNYAENEIGKLNRSNIDIGFIYSLPRVNGIFSSLIGNIINTRLEYNLNSGKVENAYLSFATNITEILRFQITYSKNFLNSISNTFVNLILDLPFVRSSSFINNDQFGQYLQGSLNYDWTNNSIKFYNRQQIGRAGAIVRLFIDENNNEKYDLGEKIIKNVKLKMTSVNTISQNKDGLIYLLDLNPYTFYKGSIVESSLKDPLLVPQFKNFSFVTEANNIKLIDIPVYFAGEIYGTVMQIKNNKANPLAGMKVNIEGVNNNFKKTVPTFSDGDFYYFGLLPGKYKIYLSKKVLKKLNVNTKPESYEIEIKSIRQGDYKKDLNFVIK